MKLISWLKHVFCRHKRIIGSRKEDWVCLDCGRKFMLVELPLYKLKDIVKENNRRMEEQFKLFH